MILSSFGCSFVWGTDLPDCSYTTSSKISWPAQIAQRLGYQHRCYAKGGRGNLFIADNILKNARGSDFVIINWTWIDRFDYVDPKGGWSTCLPADEHTPSEFYFKNYHSEYVDKLRSLIQIKVCLDYLLDWKIPFLMTYQDKLILDENWHTGSAILNLQRAVRPHLSDFNGKNHCEWAIDQGYKIIDGGHLSPEAHTAVADYLLPRINTIIIQESKNEFSI